MLRLHDISQPSLAE